MISINLKGGLCNQLFQIFATICYAVQHGHLFIFPYDDYLRVGITRPTYWNSFLKNLKPFTVANPKYKLNNNSLKKLPLLSYNQHEYIEISRVPANHNFMLDGYFQSYKYFEKYEKNIFSMIKLPQQQNDIRLEFLDYCNRENTYNISMHFRLGDYKHIQNFHNILPLEYYKKSILYIMENLSEENKQKNARILFFCEKEDNQYVLSQIKLLNNLFPTMEFLKVNDDIPDWKQMLIMSICDSCIIANSTFSWWGAYFNENNDKIITYPSVWFGPNLVGNKLDDMFPVTWTKIDI